MALEEAWDAITKFDFYMDPSGNEQGSHLPAHYVRGKSVSQFTGPYEGRNEIYSDRRNEHRHQQAMEDLHGPSQGPAYQPPVSDMSNTTRYRTGISEPRLRDNGSFAGVNLSGLAGDFTDDSKWNENVQNLAAVGAHETVHSLIDDEIEPWARKETGYIPRDERPIRETKDGENPFKAILEQWKEHEKDPAKKNYEALRSLGHEFGAFSSTPDGLISDEGDYKDESGFMSPEWRTKIMSKPAYRRIAPYVSGDKLFSELRSTKKGEPFDMALEDAWSIL